MIESHPADYPLRQSLTGPDPTVIDKAEPDAPYSDQDRGWTPSRKICPGGLTADCTPMSAQVVQANERGGDWEHLPRIRSRSC